MRVLQVNKLYYPWVGGVEKVVQSIAEGLKDRVHMRVLVCQPRGFYLSQKINGVDVFRASSIGIFRSMPLSPDFMVHFLKMARDTDIIHLHVPFPIGELSFLLSKPKAKTIASWHSEIVRHRFLSRFYKKMLLRLLDRISAIVVTSPNQLIHTPQLQKHKSKCEVIPIGIDQGKYELTPGTRKNVKLIKERYGPRIVLTVGRLVYYKGLEYLIEAMSGVKAKLLIVGKGPLMKKLTLRARELGLGEKVVFLGAVSEDELPAYYHSCDVFVLPSVEKAEAFGIVQLEAMACGKPVINTSLPTGVPFVSRHGETGLTVKPKDSSALSDAINYLLENAELREKFGKNALERVKTEFSLSKMLEKIYALYVKVQDT